jgi:O-antigen ligase
MARFAPALLLALSAAWCGTLAGGATFPGSAGFALSLLGVLAWIGTPWRDPLGLGRAGRWLPVALWAFAVVSAAASPVPRAGIVGLVLLPGFLALPGAVARCWREEADRREGLRAVSVVVAGCALWALLDRFLLGAPRAAMPLGHHNLLALWLAVLLPIAVLTVRERAPWRWLGLAAGLLAVLAVLESRSLMGTAAVVVEGFLLLLFSPLPLAGEGPGVRAPGRRVGIVLATALLLTLAALQAPRLLSILSGHDLSARARTAYFAAGFEGFLARPLLGQGPGAAAWTASLFLDPAPGVNPWGETVGELHSLPLQLAYELGAPGLLLALATAGLFVVRRWGERRGAVDPGLLRAALCGLAGGAVAFLGTASVAVAALPLAVAVAAGAALAGGGEGRSDGSVRSVRWLYPALATIALTPFLGAQALYDRALTADQGGERDVARQRLELAVRLDPGFPLYRLRLALLQGTGAAERSAAAELARRSAEEGQGLAAFWTVAGILGQASQRPWAPAALQTACSLDPLSPFPPWFGMLADPASPRAAHQGAHALLAEPRLAAALAWRRHPDLLAGALGKVQAWPGIDAVWTQALLAAVPAPAEPAGERRWLELSLDADPSASVSLFAFRRRPWPAQWPVIPLTGGPLEKLRRVGPATSRPGTPASAFAPSICTSEAVGVHRRSG